MLCQVCNHATKDILSLGYMPPVNDYVEIGRDPKPQLFLPTDLKHCPHCELVQLGYIAEPDIVFPPEYPYTSGTTKALRDNFVDLANECTHLCNLTANDLVIDIGSNDGTLLSNFRSRVLGIEPTDVANIARKKSIETISAFFNYAMAQKLSEQRGQAKVITCTNCFAHMPKVHDVVDGVLALLKPDGVFVTESHYLVSLLDGLQYDTIYHEHLRYYSLRSLKYLLDMHGLEIFRVRKTKIHGGSIRVFAARKNVHPIETSVDELLAKESTERLNSFATDCSIFTLHSYEQTFSTKSIWICVFVVLVPPHGLLR